MRGYHCAISYSALSRPMRSEPWSGIAKRVLHADGRRRRRAAASGASRSTRIMRVVDLADGAAPVHLHAGDVVAAAESAHAPRATRRRTARLPCCPRDTDSDRAAARRSAACRANCSCSECSRVPRIVLRSPCRASRRSCSRRAAASSRGRGAPAPVRSEFGPGQSMRSRRRNGSSTHGERPAVEIVGAGVDPPSGGLSTRIGTMILGWCSEQPADATHRAMAIERFTRSCLRNDDVNGCEPDSRARAPDLPRRLQARKT